MNPSTGLLSPDEFANGCEYVETMATALIRMVWIDSLVESGEAVNGVEPSANLAYVLTIARGFRDLRRELIARGMTEPT